MTKQKLTPVPAYFVALFLLLGSLFEEVKASPIIVSQGLQLNGKVEGDIQVLTASSFNLNSSSHIIGDLYVLGDPEIRKNGSVTFAGAEKGTGVSTGNYTIQLNSGARLGKIVTNTDAIGLPVVSKPQAATGTKYVNLNAGQNINDYSEVKSLNVSSNYGELALPAGNYDQIQVNSGADLVLGTANETEPQIYNINKLQLNSNTKLLVKSPVVLNIKSGLNVNQNSILGDSLYNENLIINIYKGSVNINVGGVVYGNLVAPKSYVNVGGEVCGGLSCKQLNLDSRGTLKVIEDVTVSDLTPVVPVNPVVEELDVDPPVASTTTATEVTVNTDSCDRVIVRENFSLNGLIEGDVQLFKAVNLNFNNQAELNGDLYVVGKPTVRTNGNPIFGGVEEGVGSATGNAYQIQINQGATLGKIYNRTDPVDIAPVAMPQAPQSSSHTALNQGQTISDWSKVGSLVLNSGYGNISMPSGAYGRITLNQNTSLTLGTANSEQATVYHFETLTVNSDAQVIIVGPVILNIKSGLRANSRSEVGVLTGDDPSSFVVNVYSSDVHVNAEGVMNAKLNAPESQIHVNGTFTGELIVKHLTVNSQGAVHVECSGDTTAPENQAPLAVAQTLSTLESTELNILLSGSDPEGEALNYSVVTQPVNGTLSGNAPNLVYTPAVGYNGPDNFTFKVNDGELDSEVASIAIVVIPVNGKPVAIAQTLTTPEDTALNIVLNGSDPEGSNLVYSIESQPSNGTLTGTAPNVLYTPTNGYHGADSFTFKVNDGALDSDVVIVAITVTPVNDKPIAVAQALTTTEDTALNIVLTGSDPEGSAKRRCSECNLYTKYKL